MKLRRHLLLPLLALAMVGFTATAAHADSIVYTFSGTSLYDGLPVAFQFTSQGFVNGFLPLDPVQLDSCTNCFDGGSPAVYFSIQPPYGDQIQFNDSDNVGNVYMFALGDFSTLGTFYSTSPYNPGELQVSDADVAPVPEPGALLLFGSGLAGIAGTIRRKFRK